MKYNLKNMPDAPSKEVIAWRKEIEKELREILDSIETDRYYDSNEIQATIKEILGE